MFYVNTTTKKFAPHFSSDSFQEEYGCCCDATQVPLFLRTKVIPPSPIHKPSLVNFQTATLQFQFKDAQGNPYDLTSASLRLVVDNTFSHSDSLICLSSQYTITDPVNGIAQFTVNCASKKFCKIVAARLPSTEIWMEITAYTQQNLQGTVLLQDKGISLRPRLYGTQDVPQDGDPNYYNKQQIDVLIGSFISSDSASKAGLFQIFQQHFYNKEQVDTSLQELSNSFNTKLENYYNKSQIDAISSALSDSIAAVNTKIGQITIRKASNPQQGFAATYNLIDWNGQIKGDSINIIQDSLLRSIEVVESATIEDQQIDPSVIIGDPYLKLTFYVQQEAQGTDTSVAYVPLNYLKDVYKAGNGLKLANGEFSLKLSSDSFTGAHLAVTNKGLAISLNDYYNKNQVQGLIDVLTVLVGGLQQNFNNYYNKEQIDTITSALSDSIVGIKQSFGGYYTKSEVDGIAQQLSNSINNIKSTFNSYYTKSEINGIVDTISDSIAAVKNTFSNYYNKEQIDQKLLQLSNSVDLSDYYTKGEVDSYISALSDSIQAVKGAFSGYYTKGQVDTKLGALSDSIAAVNGKFASYYNKEEVNSFVEQLSNSIGSVKSSVQNMQQTIEDLSDAVDARFDDYYTKNQVNGIAGGLSNSFNGKLQGYYNKDQVDAKIGALSDSIQSINAKFSDYYTKSQTDQFIGQLSDSILAVRGLFSGYYNKDQIDQKLLQLSNSVDLSDYYTKEEVNSVVGQHNSDSAAHSSLFALKQDVFKHVQLQSPSFKPQNAVIYTYTPQQSDSIQFTQGTPGLFYLQFEMSSDSVTFQLPSMQWQGAPPAFTAGSDILVQVLYDGTTYRASSYPDLSDFARLSTDNQFAAGISVRGKFVQGYDEGSAEWLATPDTAFSCNSGKATGAYSHAEGRDCQANSPNSHAEGRSCICNGGGHAQGYACVINNSVNYAHVQGQSCVAAGSRQHVAGKYNKTVVDAARITGNGNSNTRSNCQVLDWDGNLWISGHLRSAGHPIMDYSDSVALQQGVIYKHTLQQSDSIVLDTSAFTSSRQVAFELHLTQPSTAVTFTWPANIVWGDGTYFGSANTPPDMSIASTVYAVVFRWDGQQLLGNLAYIKDAAE